MKTTLGLVLGLLCASYSHAAVQINIFSNPSTAVFVLPDLSPLSSDAVLHVGLFDTSAFDELEASLKTDAGTVFSLFTSLTSYNFVAGGVNRLDDPLSGGTASDQLFAFVSDTQRPSEASAFGVFTSSNEAWLYPNDLGSATLSMGFVDSASVGFLDLENKRLILEVSGGLGAIPEPASMAFMLSGAMLSLGAFRRRR
jgi:hypothetical protein